ncbi:MAG: TetR family transcriptional regulator [Muribaculaceae bacterium]|nr:TetR family transcriptional regulator [Muribaculaceae bacterium]
MVSKTRDKFIEVARQLFARKGVENTTMNDIASASSKGRRTIYTYFKSKTEIFNAVIETETDKILSRLRIILAANIPPDEKVREYISTRFEAMKEIVGRNGSLRAGFFRDVRKVERAQRMIASKEVALLCEILQEGVDQGVFKAIDVKKQSIIIIHMVQGLVVPYIRESLNEEGISTAMIKAMTADMILYGLSL